MRKQTLYSMFIILIIVCAVFILINKPDIHQAELSDIQGINGFGEVLSERVVSYLDANPDADIEDLEAIDGIGPYRIKLLRKEFR